MFSCTPRPHHPQKVQTINIFFHPEVFAHLDSAIKKIFEPILNPEIKKKWIAYTNLMLPKSKLGYSSQEEYLKTISLTEEDITQNTIAYVFPNLPSIDIKFLTKEFIIFSKKAHIVIVHIDHKNIVLYREIYLALVYMKNIRQVIDKNKKLRSSSHHGLQKNSKPKALLKSLKSYLEERLDHPYFPIVNDEERERIKLQISYINKALSNEFKILYDLFNFSNIFLGLDYPLLRLSKNDQITIHQLITLFNGIKSSNEELVMSCMIYMRYLTNIVDKNDYDKLSQSILNIAIQFYNDVYILGQKKRSKRGNHFTYNKTYIDKEYRIKTFIDQLPIYSFKTESNFDFLQEMMELTLKSFKGESNIFQPELPTDNPTSAFQVSRNIIQMKKAFHLTKEELHSIFSLSKLLGITN